MDGSSSYLHRNKLVWVSLLPRARTGVVRASYSEHLHFQISMKYVKLLSSGFRDISTVWVSWIDFWMHRSNYT